MPGSDFDHEKYIVGGCVISDIDPEIGCSLCGWEGVVGNVANRQCPMCRSTDIDQKWNFGNYFFQCNKCGERLKS
jgi:hypothetical protein